MNFIAADWPAPSNVHARTTTRAGFGEHNPKEVEERRKLCDLLTLPSEPIWLNQIHGTKVVKATPDKTDIDADGAYTDEANRVCVIFTADCLPIFICNKQGTKVSVLHAGWRGLAAGIIDQALQSLAIPAEDMLVWLGPAIGPNQFEVGKDVLDAFTAQNQEAEAAFIAKENNKWNANLYALATQQLNTQGIKQVYGGNYCTYTQDDLFFSYRRDKGAPGRLANLIWLST